MEKELIAEARQVLKKYFGFSSFRPNQEEAVSAILGGKDLFAAMPTGGGKSLCYQLPAIILPGTAIVISPLIALMYDQVESAKETGIKAEFLNSTLNQTETAEIFYKLHHKQVDLLYISPERFALKGFSQYLSQFPVSFFAIDEAHCLSEWGHDFRPDYLALSQISDIFPDIPIAAFTATATKHVQSDIITQLRLKAPRIIRASFDRPELTYRIIPKDNANRQMLQQIRARKGESGIIYRTSRKAVEQTAKFLQDAGIKALPYHAGLSAQQREKNQDLFNRDEIQVITATIAFGMGIDKSNIRFVIHGDLPRSIESYYQETGRAGRDGEQSDCTLLYSAGDSHKIRFFIDKMHDEEQQMRSFKSLQQMLSFASHNVCRRKQLLNHFNEEYNKGNCGNCDVCKGETHTEEATISAQKLLSAIIRTGERFGAVHIVDILMGSNNEKIKKFGHHELPTWGIGKDKHRSYWLAVTQELKGQEFLKQEQSNFNALQLTYGAKEILRGNIKFFITRFKQPKEKKAPLIDSELNYDRVLFEKLRELRLKIARSKKIAPFIVFNDKTLKQMAALKPKTKTEILDVSGVGENKYELYGESFIKEISLN